MKTVLAIKKTCIIYKNWSNIFKLCSTIYKDKYM